MKFLYKPIANKDIEQKTIDVLKISSNYISLESTQSGEKPSEELIIEYFKKII